MIGKAVSVLFLSRDVAHRAHLSAHGANSYAEHMILGDFYDCVVDQADALAEAYQGHGTLIEDIPYMSHDGEGSIHNTLKKHLVLIQRYREKCEVKTAVMMAAFDNVESLYLSTLYKLKFLK